MADCANCKKSPPEVTLKRCAKCSETQYCSRDCQKADWKSHRKICGKQNTHTQQPSSGTTPSDYPSASTSLSPPRGLDAPVTKPFTRLDNGTWLHGRPEADVYRLLIDAYRMRMQDNYTFDGDADEDSVYGGAADATAGFARFLAAVEQKQQRAHLLPAWWDDTHKADCVAFGRGGGPDGWSSLARSVDKADVTERYGDARFAMQLRMFAEAVYGTGPGGSDGTAMRKSLVAMENGRTYMGMDMREMTHLTIDQTTGGVTPLVP